jgi:hypothetical protein
MNNILPKNEPFGPESMSLIAAKWQEKARFEKMDDDDDPATEKQRNAAIMRRLKSIMYLSDLARQVYVTLPEYFEKECEKHGEPGHGLGYCLQKAISLSSTVASELNEKIIKSGGSGIK